METKTVYIGIDYGIKRVGFAIYTSDSSFVFPLCTLDRSVKTVFFENLSALVEKHKPTAFILGLPFHEDGSPCITTSQVKNFASSLARRYPIPIYFMEELLSSFEAEQELKQAGFRSKKIKANVDQVAAVKILESFLECSKPTLFTPTK